MSTMGSMATAISGLEANGQALSLISDNIVNANTTGYKSSRGEFQSVLAQDLGSASASQIGRGVNLAGITGLFTQGAITKTDRGTDLAVNGNGFFVLNHKARGQTFTRDGSFRFDKEGWLTTLNGVRVQAYEATPAGRITGKLGDIRIPYDTIPAKPTNDIQLHVNLDARTPIGPDLDIDRPEETSQFTTATQIYDSVGNARPVSVYFNKVEEGTWSWVAMTDGSNLADGEPGLKSPIASGELLFNQEGRLESASQEIINTSFLSAIPDQDLFFDFGDPLEDFGTGEKGTTQYGSKSAMFRNYQNGYGAGVLLDTSIDGDGIIRGIYSNGLDRTLGQLAIARFEATERLSKAGENQFKESIRSGEPLIGKPNTNGLGTLMNRSLENSNVDLAHEFVDMIKAQRGFQASAKSITAANDMLDELIGIVARSQ